MSTTSALPCVTIPPVSVTIASTSTTSATITWVAPVTTGAQSPIGYKLEVYDIAGTIPPLLSVTLGPTPLTYNVTDPSIVAGTEYIVRIYALYDCGTSSYVQTQGVLKSVAYAAKIFYSNVLAPSPKPENCTNPIGPVITPFVAVQRTARVDLKDSLGNPLINSGSPIEVKIRTEYIACSSDPIVETDFVLTIPTGQTYGSVTYTESTMIYCPGEGCIMDMRNVLCLVSVTLAGGGALPTTIGLDTSLTSLGSC